jgi:hypothetical protein
VETRSRWGSSSRLQHARCGAIGRQNGEAEGERGTKAIGVESGAATGPVHAARRRTTTAWRGAGARPQTPQITCLEIIIEQAPPIRTPLLLRWIE